MDDQNIREELVRRLLIRLFEKPELLDELIKRLESDNLIADKITPDVS
jgi:hypothetical protein